MFDCLWRAKPAKRKLQLGREPTGDRDFYINWSKENSKEIIKTANTALGQLLTISTALFAGMVALWKGLPIIDPLKIIALILLLTAVFTSLLSSMPYSGRYDTTNPADIERYFNEVISYKLSRLKRSKWALIVAISTITFALADDVFHFIDLASTYLKLTS